MTSFHDILNRALTKQIDESSDIDVNIVQQLHDRGFIDAVEDNTLGPLCYFEPRINFRGQEWLEK